MNLAEQILSVPDERKRIAVPMPEWGDKTVYVQSLNADEIDRIKEIDARHEKVDKVYSWGTFLMAVVDENGEPVFTDEHVPQLRKRSMPAIMRLFRMSNKLNGFTEDIVEQLEKN